MSNSSIRGTALVFFVAVIPAAAIIMLATLTRSEIGLREARREQDRAQAQLLAESALALRQAGVSLTGQSVVIDGVGELRLEIISETNLLATGAVRSGPEEITWKIRQSGGLADRER